MQVSVCSVIMTGYNILMPEKRVKIHRNDPPWISEELKHLITLRQRAFSSGNISEQGQQNEEILAREVFCLQIYQA